jgi:transposase-like protein
MFSDEIRNECVRLRVEERVSTAAIHRKTGVSVSTLKGWLKTYPLDSSELLSHKREHVEFLASQKKKPRGEESRLYRLSESSNLSPSQRGNLAEAAVLVRLIAAGHTPLRGVFEGNKSDWLVPVGGKTLRVQVKLAYKSRQGVPVVPLRSASQKKPYQVGEVDILVGFDLLTDTCYVWTWGEIANRLCGVSVCPEAEERWDKILGV